jgi:hypothetical protein
MALVFDTVYSVMQSLTVYNGVELRCTAQTEFKERFLAIPEPCTRLKSSTFTEVYRNVVRGGSDSLFNEISIQGGLRLPDEALLPR